MRALKLPLIGLLFALIYQIAIIFGGGRLHYLMVANKAHKCCRSIPRYTSNNGRHRMESEHEVSFRDPGIASDYRVTLGDVN